MDEPNRKSGHGVSGKCELVRLEQDDFFSLTTEKKITPEKRPPENRPKTNKSCFAVEPYAFLTCFAFVIRVAVNPRLNVEKVCVTVFGYTREVCRNVDRDHPQFADMQKDATDITIASSLVSAIPSIVMGILIASFCDKYGKKMPMIIAPVGVIIEMVGMALCVIFFESSAWWIVVCNVPSGFTGSLMVSLSCSFALTSRRSSGKNRPLRFAILEGVVLVGFNAGLAGGGLIYKQFGFLPIYVISAIANVLAMLYLACALDEDDRLTKSMTYREVAAALFSADGVRDNARFLLKKREGNIRAQIIALLLVTAIGMMPMIGTSSITLNYVELRYKWGVDTYSYMASGAKMASSVVVAVAVAVLSRRMHVNPLMIAMIGAVSQAIQYILRAFSPELFIASFVVGCLGGCLNVGLKTRLTALCPDELAKVFVLVSFFELMMPAVANSLFGIIYRSTLSSFIELAFLVAAAIFIIPLVTINLILLRGTPPPKPQPKPLSDSIERF